MGCGMISDLIIEMLPKGVVDPVALRRCVVRLLLKEHTVDGSHRQVKRRLNLIRFFSTAR
jgi:hypothetical protein